MRRGNELSRIFQGDSRNRTRCGKQNNVRTTGSELSNVFLCENAFTTLRKDTCCVHFSGNENRLFPYGGMDGSQARSNGSVCYPISRISSQHKEFGPHSHKLVCIFGSRQAPFSNRPEFSVLLLKCWINCLQIDTNDAASQVS